jgi:hypothetical protein
MSCINPERVRSSSNKLRNLDPDLTVFVLWKAVERSPRWLDYTHQLYKYIRWSLLLLPLNRMLSSSTIVDGVVTGLGSHACSKAAVLPVCGEGTSHIQLNSLSAGAS